MLALALVTAASAADSYEEIAFTYQRISFTEVTGLDNHVEVVAEVPDSGVQLGATLSCEDFSCATQWSAKWELAHYDWDDEIVGTARLDVDPDAESAVWTSGGRPPSSDERLTVLVAWVDHLAALVADGQPDWEGTQGRRTAVIESNGAGYRITVRPQ